MCFSPYSLAAHLLGIDWAVNHHNDRQADGKRWFTFLYVPVCLRMCVNNASSDVCVTTAMEIMGEICFENAFRQNEKRANMPLQEVQ